MKQHLAFALKLQINNLTRNILEEVEGLAKANANLSSSLEYTKSKVLYGSDAQRTEVYEAAIKKNLNESKKLTVILEDLNDILTRISED